MAQLVERTLGKGEVPSSTLGISTSFSVKVWHLEKNLSGGCSAVVPPDPMPNSEVKRRSADGSVGSPHARVGNCQTSNKNKRPSRKTGPFVLSVKRQCCIRRMTLMNNLRQKRTSAFRFGVSKKLIRCCLFNNLAKIHKDHPVGHCAGKAHFMGNTQHGHA